MLHQLFLQNRLVLFVDQLDQLDQSKLQLVQALLSKALGQSQSGMGKIGLVTLVIACRRSLAGQFLKFNDKVDVSFLQMPNETILLRSILPSASRKTDQHGQPVPPLLLPCAPAVSSPSAASVEQNNTVGSSSALQPPICDFFHVCSNWATVQAFHYLTIKAIQSKHGQVNLLEGKMSYIWRQIKLESRLGHLVPLHKV